MAVPLLSLRSVRDCNRPSASKASSVPSGYVSVKSPPLFFTSVVKLTTALVVRAERLLDAHQRLPNGQRSITASLPRCRCPHFAPKLVPLCPLFWCFRLSVD